MLIFFIADKIAIRYGLVRVRTSVDSVVQFFFICDTPVLLQWMIWFSLYESLFYCKGNAFLIDKK
ncbi:hypothetical protein F522_04820 [Enterococcus hirae 81-15-F4]|nr:hypothetical protein F522_04820 [Enterococcus hirae 81-15-F4]